MLHCPKLEVQPETALYGSIPWSEYWGSRSTWKPLIDAKAYISDIRAVGANLHPIRGKDYCFGEVDGRYGLIIPLDPPEIRNAVSIVEHLYADVMAADPVAHGRVAESLFREMVIARAAAAIGYDYEKARHELHRLDKIARQTAEDEGRLSSIFHDLIEASGQTDRRNSENEHLVVSTGYRAAAEDAELAGEEYYGFEEYVVSMPIQSDRDAIIKLRIALEFAHCEFDGKLIMQQIAAYEEASRAQDQAIFAAIDRHKAAEDEFCRRAEDLEDRLDCPIACKAYDKANEAATRIKNDLVAIVPQTAAGARALLEYAREVDFEGLEIESTLGALLASPVLCGPIIAAQLPQTNLSNFQAAAE